MMFLIFPLIGVFFLPFLSDALDRSLDRRARLKRRVYRRATAASKGDAGAAYRRERETEWEDDTLQVQVFRLAARNRGLVTLLEVIVETGLDVDKAEKLMDRMVDGTRVRIEITENGMIIYEFPELTGGTEAQEV